MAAVRGSRRHTEYNYNVTELRLLVYLPKPHVRVDVFTKMAMREANISVEVAKFS